MIPLRAGIEKRPMEATDRTVYGHYEGDTIVSRKGGRGGLSVLSERKSRLVKVKKLHSLSPEENLRAIIAMKKTLHMKTLTFDNGLENKKHASLGVDTYFCDPYSSWQKGGVEHANKMLRGYFPKGTDFTDVPERSIQKAERLINEKPRKILGYMTAFEAAIAGGVYLGESNPSKMRECPN